MTGELTDAERAEFTPEELGILGEGPAPAENAAPAEAAPAENAEEQKAEGEAKPEETPAAEAQAAAAEEKKEEPAKAEDEERENMIPQKRFNEVYGKQKTLETKLDLLKRVGPERYYEIYPEERPKEEPKPERKAPLIDYAEAGQMTVQGGPYNGRTLNEVYAVDPAAANALFYSYAQEQRAREDKRVQAEQETRDRAVGAMNEWGDERAQEAYGKKYGDLDEQQKEALIAEGTKLVEWVRQRGYTAIHPRDAWFLMNRETIIKAAEEKATKAFAESLKKQPVASVSGGKIGSEQPSGFDAFMQMSAEQLAARVDRMAEGEYEKFLKDAPKELRAKFPGVQWG